MGQITKGDKMDSPGNLSSVMWKAIDKHLAAENPEKFPARVMKLASEEPILPLLVPEKGLTVAEIYLYYCMNNKPNRTSVEKN